MDLVVHDPPSPTSGKEADRARKQGPAVFGTYDLKASVVFPSISNPPVVSSTLKPEEPEIGMSSDLLTEGETVARSLQYLIKQEKHERSVK